MRVTPHAGALLPHRFTLTTLPKQRGGLLSVAQTDRSPRPDSRQLSCPRSPDFPQYALSKACVLRPPGRLTVAAVYSNWRYGLGSRVVTTDGTMLGIAVVEGSGFPLTGIRSSCFTVHPVSPPAATPSSDSERTIFAIRVGVVTAISLATWCRNDSDRSAFGCTSSMSRFRNRSSTQKSRALRSLCQPAARLTASCHRSR